MIRSKSADPLYRFVRNGKAGYIDSAGKVVIEPKFDAYGNYGAEFHDGLLEISVSNGRYVDTSGNLVWEKGYYRGWDFSEGLAVAMRKDGEKWGYIDRSGEFVISPRFETYPKGYVYSFSEGLAMIKVADKYGYIDRSGEFIIAPQFLHGADFHDGMARVVVEGPCSYAGDGPCPDFRTLPEKVEGEVPYCKFSFIDKSGLVLAERYDRAKEFSEGLAPVRVGESWGYINKKGRIMIEPRFDNAEPFSDGLACIQQAGLYGYIDYAGTLVIAPHFKYAEKFAEGLAVVGDWESREFYYINKRGQQAIPAKYALASHFFNGLAHVKLKSQRTKHEDSDYAGKFAYIAANGKKVFTYEHKP